MRKRAGIGLLLLGTIFGILVSSAFQTFVIPTQVDAVAGPKPPPVPTYTPTPAAPDRPDYTTAATIAQDSLAAAMAQLGVLIAFPRLGESAWLAEINQAMTQVEAAYATLLRLEPPEPWQPFHQRMIAGAADCSAAMHVLAFALEEQQPAAVEVVAALLGRCEAKLAEAKTLADEVAP
jgi:hypothetical protein